MKLNDLAEYEKETAIIDKNGNILCPDCKKRLALVTEYGLIRRCKRCQTRLNKFNENSSFNIQFKTSKYGGSNLNVGHYKHMMTRCLDKNGKALSGKKGLDYMKQNGNVYADRLKRYYDVSDA
jgi:uncharacterized protein YbaR (Trm112 family)